MRARAAKFAEEWKDAKYEKGETQSFYNEFFHIFNQSRRKVATFEEPVKKLGLGQGFIDLFWKGVLLVEQKSAGKNLDEAKDQAFAYLHGLKDAEFPRYMLICDFQNFWLMDLEERDEVRFKLHELPNHVEKFGFILGRNKRSFKDQDPVNIKASRLMGRLHDELFNAKYRGHDLEQFLVRLLFCLFADDTSIFEPRDIFLDFIRERTKEDGSDLGPMLTKLFQTLNEPESERETNLDEDFAKFPYINGDLFAGNLKLPSFDTKMRDLLIEACEFNWEGISPAIFGALFQHVSGDVEARRALGEHYTTEKNILKVIEPLFLDDLREELAGILRRKGNVARLHEFQRKLASLRFFDPACGCGNFLIIAYREIRRLELEVIRALHPEAADQSIAVEGVRQVRISQFYGIEINEFPARIAEVAMWMMDHIMNLWLGEFLGKPVPSIPLVDSPNIKHADALETIWEDVLNPAECDYVLGNPPFLGAKVQTEQQRIQVRSLANLGGSGGTLDLVAAWYLKAGSYIRGHKGKIGFVSTNSITQGEQVAQLWPILFDRYGLEIAFAHRTFSWGSDVSSVAHVHVVILGLVQAKDEPKEKRLFDYEDIKGEPVEYLVPKLSPYLIDAGRFADPHLVIQEASAPRPGRKSMGIGSKPVDGGNLILTQEEYENAVMTDANCIPWLRKFVDAQDYLNGRFRYILAVHGAEPEQVKASPVLVERLRATKSWRAGRASEGTKKMAATPGLYHVNVIPSAPFLLIPRHTSELREYVPIGFVQPDSIPSDASIVMLDAEPWDFAILTSRMHMAWLREVGGRLKSDYRYSIGIVYNNFPWPVVSDAQKAKVEGLARAVLDARAAHPGATLADLYDPVTMPADLRKAHTALDKAVDALYLASGFASDRDRVEHLFMLYEAMVNPMAPMMQDPVKKGRRRR